MRHSHLIRAAIAACAILAAQIASAATLTWNGSVSGDWSNASNWTPNAVPQGGDDVILPAVAPNQTQTAISVGSLATPLASLTFQGGGYYVGNSSATLIFGTTITSTGNNEIAAAVFQQNNPSYISNNGTLTFSGHHDTKGLANLGGNGTIDFNSAVVVNSVNRSLDMQGPVTARFNDALGGFGQVFSSNRAAGVRTRAAGTILVNGGPASPATGNASTITNVWSITAGGTLGGNGALFSSSANNGFGVSIGSGIVAIGYLVHNANPGGSGTLAPGDPLVNNGIGTLTITADHGVKFGGQGTVNDPATGSSVNSGTDTGTFLVQLGDGTSSDRLNITGDLDLSSSVDVLRLNLLSGANPGGDYVLASYSGARSGTFNSVFLGATDITAIATSSFMVSNVRYRLDYGSGSNSQIELIALPEPSLGLATIVSAMLTLRCRRNRA